MKSMGEIYLNRLKKMMPVQRLMIAIELTEIVKAIAIAGIKRSNVKLKHASAVRKLRERINKGSRLGR